MKKIVIKAFSIIVLFGMYFLFACSSEEGNSEDSKSDEVTNDEYTAEYIKNAVSQTGDAQVSKTGIITDNTGKTYTWDTEAFNEQNILSEQYDFSAVFLWKQKVKDYMVICVEAERMTAMSESDIDFWLVSFDKDFNKTDELFYYQIKQDASGGTYEDPIVKYLNEMFITDAGTYGLNKDGKFVKNIGNIEPEPLKEFSDLFEKYTKFPVVFDSAFFAGISETEFNELTAQEVKTLYKKGKEIGDIYSNVNTFIKIDSMRQTGTYDDFLNSDPWPEVIHSNAYAMYHLKLNADTSAYIWKIYDATSESGPWSYGAVVYISFVVNNSVVSSCTAAELSSSGDSPAYGEKEVYMTFYKNGKIVLNYKEVFGDDDSGEEQITKKNFEYKLTRGELSEIKTTE